MDLVFNQIGELTEEKIQTEFRIQAESETRRMEWLPIVQKLEVEVEELKSALVTVKEKKIKADEEIVPLVDIMESCLNQVSMFLLSKQGMVSD